MESTGAVIVSAGLYQSEAMAAPATESKPSPSAGNPPSPLVSASDPLPSRGTVVLDVEQGGIVVPSFAGKSVRSAIEMAEDSGLDLAAVGSGLARDQTPAAGSHVAAGSQVTVKFAR